MNEHENIETTQIKEPKSSRNWNGWDVFFFSLPVVCVVLFPLDGLDYLCGRFIPLFYSLVRLPMCFMIMGCLGFCLFVQIFRFQANLSKHTRKKRVLLIAELLAPAVLFYLSLAVCFVPVERRVCGSDYRSFAHGFGDRIRSKADIEAIREWLRMISDSDYTGNPDTMTFDELPECLQVLRPKGIHTWTDDNGNVVIEMFWGSSFAGAWGVVIGAEDMEIPPSDFRDDREYRLRMEPGVYVWCRLKGD